MTTNFTLNDMKLPDFLREDRSYQELQQAIAKMQEEIASQYRAIEEETEARIKRALEMHGGEPEDYVLISSQVGAEIDAPLSWLDRIRENNPTYKFVCWLPFFPWEMRLLVKDEKKKEVEKMEEKNVVGPQLKELLGYFLENMDWMVNKRDIELQDAPVISHHQKIIDALSDQMPDIPAPENVFEFYTENPWLGETKLDEKMLKNGYNFESMAHVVLADWLYWELLKAYPAPEGDDTCQGNLS